MDQVLNNNFAKISPIREESYLRLPVQLKKQNINMSKIDAKDDNLSFLYSFLSA